MNNLKTLFGLIFILMISCTSQEESEPQPLQAKIYQRSNLDDTFKSEVILYSNLTFESRNSNGEEFRGDYYRAATDKEENIDYSLNIKEKRRNCEEWEKEDILILMEYSFYKEINQFTIPTCPK